MSIQKILEELDKLVNDESILCYSLYCSDDVNKINKIIIGINNYTVIEISSDYIQKWFGPVSFLNFTVIKNAIVIFNKKTKKYELQFQS